MRFTNSSSPQRLQVPGPRWLRIPVYTLLIAAVLAPLVAALDWWAATSVDGLLPGPSTPRLGIGWTIAVALVGGLALAASIEWGLSRATREAAALADAGDQIGAVRRFHEATGGDLAEACAAIQAHLDARPGELPEEVRQLAEAGDQLHAIERLRQLQGLPVEEAMLLVERHLAARAGTCPSKSN